jgi:hypothetical protein
MADLVAQQGKVLVYTTIGHVLQTLFFGKSPLPLSLAYLIFVGGMERNLRHSHAHRCTYYAVSHLRAQVLNISGFTDDGRRARGVKSRARKVLFYTTIFCFFMSGLYWMLSMTSLMDSFKIVVVENRPYPDEGCPIGCVLTVYESVVLVNVSRHSFTLLRSLTQPLVWYY